MIKTGDDLAELIMRHAARQGINIQTDDIFVITQKIVSKSENRLVNLNKVIPSRNAMRIAKISEKDPRFVQLVLNESNEIVRVRPGTLITEHKLGFICANAGIDHSNVKGEDGEAEDSYLLLPKNPDRSARKIRRKIEKEKGVRIGILIIDSHGRAWRLGVTGVCIGISGMPALVDMRGEEDLFGYKLRITQIGVADDLAAAASLMMGEAAEATPVVHVRGFPYRLRESKLNELMRDRTRDLFR